MGTSYTNTKAKTPGQNARPARPPARHVPLPAPVYNTRTKTLATLKAQSKLISYLLQTFTQTQIEMVSCGAIVTDGWYYDKDIEQHKGWLSEKK